MCAKQFFNKSFIFYKQILDESKKAAANEDDTNSSSVANDIALKKLLNNKDYTMGALLGKALDIYFFKVTCPFFIDTVVFLYVCCRRYSWTGR